MKALLFKPLQLIAFGLVVGAIALADPGGRARAGGGAPVNGAAKISPIEVDAVTVVADGGIFGSQQTGTIQSTAAANTFALQCTVSGEKVATGTTTYWTETNTTGSYVSNGATVATFDRTNGPTLYTPGVATTYMPEGTLVTNTTAVGNVGASGPDDLQSNPLVAGLFNANGTGRCVRITATGTAANNANAKTVRLVAGAGPTVLVTKQLTASLADTWQITAVICRTGANTQRYWVSAEQSGGTLISTTDGTTIWRIPTVTGTLSETEANAMTVKTQSTVSTADNDVVSNVLSQEWF